MKKLTLIFGIALILGGCKSSDSSKEQNPTEKSTKDSVVGMKSTLSDEELNNIIDAIPSPLELSTLIQYSGAKYNQSLLNNTLNKAKYNSQFSKAMNLGIYGADLGYVNMYEKTYSAMEYLNTVYALSNDLNIGDFFDFNTLKRLATNNKNLDSIVFITTRGFEKMHHQLKQTHNSHISVLILVGGWIEGMYLTTGIIQSNPTKSDDLIFTIYDEHIVLDDILKMMNAFKTNPNFEEVILNLENLKKKYDTIIAANSKSNVSVTPEQFAEISKEIQAIRTKLVE